METRYILNHFYKLRHDEKRSHILTSSYIEKEHSNLIQLGWTSRIHPVLAMVLSFFSNPISLSELKKELAFFLDISEDKAEELAKMFLDNSEFFHIDYEGKANYFPKNIVIEESKQFRSAVQYSPEQFAYKELDLDRERYYVAPATLVFMVNNNCATDCIYCYANKSVRNTPLPFNRVKEIIREARSLGIPKFALVGGEVFLYKYWKELLSFLIENDMKEMLVSTKVPLKEADIVAIKSYGMGVQVSLDAIDSDRLQKILNVKSDYSEKIQNTIRLLNKHGISFQISTVLTKYNRSIEDLKALYSFLSQFENLRRWEIRVAFKSLYSREDFETIKFTREEIDQIDKWASETQEVSNINILWASSDDEKYFKGKNGSRSFKGSRCSANYSNLFILPDGKVSICEQLYWDPRFIIGDLTKQTIKEVWSSPEALKLAFPKRENFRDESVCKKCNIFDECIVLFPNRCIADIIKGYGKENYDYPDPRCNKAPAFTHSLLAE